MRNHSTATDVTEHIHTYIHTKLQQANAVQCTRTATTGINYAEGAQAKFWPNLLRGGGCGWVGLGGVGGWCGTLGLVKRSPGSMDRRVGWGAGGGGGGIQD